MAKEFTQLTPRPADLSRMILGIPIMQLLLFGYAINNDPRHLPTAVLVAGSAGRWRARWSARSSAARYFDVRRCCHAPSRDGPADPARQGAVLAITIPADFTAPRGARRPCRRSWSRPMPRIRSPRRRRARLRSRNCRSRRCAHDLKGRVAPAATNPPFEVVVHRRYNPENITSYNIVPGPARHHPVDDAGDDDRAGRDARVSSAARWRACSPRRCGRSR